MKKELSRLINECADILKHSSYSVAFTGAGISTASGIPDFRSVGSGLWEKDDPFSVASLSAFRQSPKKFFNWIKPLFLQSHNAKPNSAHTALAEMETAGFIQSVITQNIDGLHQAAGSKNVIELHGTAQTATCPICTAVHNADDLLTLYSKTEKIPTCKNCGQIIKPDVVLFEEMLPESAWYSAEQEIEKSETILVIGSSLEVYPASSLPKLGVRKGAKLIINTLSSTPLDKTADMVINADVTEVIPEIFRLLNA